MRHDNLQKLLMEASSKYRSVRLAVIDWADLRAYRRSLSRYPHNPRIAAILADPLFPHGGRAESVWRLWLDRPHRRLLEHFKPRDRLEEISGGDERHYWQYFPGKHRAYETEARADDSDSAWPQFTRWLHPVVAELLDPSFLWRTPEGAVREPTLELTGRGQHLGREALRVRAKVLDWESRDLWSENLWVADEYEFLVDADVGVLLRISCLLDDEEFSVRELFDVAFDVPIDSSLFLLRAPPDTSLDLHEQS
jgi:hypothetical protein